MTQSTPVAFIQYGEFRNDYLRLRDGGEEHYQAQRRSVEFQVGLGTEDRPIAVVCVATQDIYDERLSGAHVVGLGPRGHGTTLRQWWRLLDRLSPDRLILRTPLWPVLLWAVVRRTPMLVVLADSFPEGGIRKRVRNRLLARLMRARTIGAIGNHGRRASLELAALGIPKTKIIPWDWTPSRTPHESGSKSGIDGDGPIQILFAGALVAAKGVDDLILATAKLVEDGRKVVLHLLGSGDGERVRGLAEQLGVGDQVVVHGVVPNASVVARMREADIVVVPSRHDYPEGLPLTIYEALVSRTPLIVSDHPMFRGSVVDGESALVFPAGQPEQLAACVEKLAGDPALYAALSRNGAAAWDRLQLPVKFEALVERWIQGDRAWLQTYSLAGTDYTSA